MWPFRRTRSAADFARWRDRFFESYATLASSALSQVQGGDLSFLPEPYRSLPISGPEDVTRVSLAFNAYHACVFVLASWRTADLAGLRDDAERRVWLDLIKVRGGDVLTDDAALLQERVESHVRAELEAAAQDTRVASGFPTKHAVLWFCDRLTESGPGTPAPTSAWGWLGVQFAVYAETHAQWAYNGCPPPKALLDRIASSWDPNSIAGRSD